MTKYKTCVGNHTYTPWKNYSRESLVYSAKELGLENNFIAELTDEELFNTILKVSSKENANLNLNVVKGE